MAKKNQPLPPEAYDVGMLRVVGEHVGEGWVCLDVEHAHPGLQMYFSGGLVLIPKLADAPLHARVNMIFYATKNSMKLADYSVKGLHY